MFNYTLVAHENTSREEKGWRRDYTYTLKSEVSLSVTCTIPFELFFRQRKN